MEVIDIIEAIRANRIRVTDHADEEASADHLNLDEIVFSVSHGEIIEKYETDRPYPSCLILGQTDSGVAVHSVWAYNKESKWAVMITVYRPDPERWVNWRERKKAR
jgi:uncharacterized protein DUF4258